MTCGTTVTFFYLKLYNKLVMSILNVTELQKLVLADYKTNKLSLHVINEFITSLNAEIKSNLDFLHSQAHKLPISEDLLLKINYLIKNQIELETYNDTVILQTVYESMEEIGVTIIDLQKHSILKLQLVENLIIFKYLESKFLLKVKYEGYLEQYKAIRDISKWVNTKTIIKHSIQLIENIRTMQELKDDLEREKRKNEQQIYDKERRRLLKELQVVKINYKKDCILLIKGLMETEGNYYYTLRGQMDQYYRNEIEEKLIRINKLLNMQEKVYLDNKTLREKISLIKTHNKKLRDKLKLLLFN